MHPEIERYLRGHLGWERDAGVIAPPDPAAWMTFVEAVDAAYAQADLDRDVLARALAECSAELEAARQQQEQALSIARVMQQQFEDRMAEVEGILAGAPHPILMTDRDGSIVRASAAAQTVLGWAPEALVGLNIETIIPEAFDYWRIRARRASSYARLRDLGERAKPVTAEFTATRADGTELAVETTLVDVEDAEGGYRVVVELVDLTARRRAEAQARVLQKSEALGTLVAGVAHDFNNILTIIGGSFAAAQQDNPDRDHWIGVGERATDRAVALVASLLRFSRRAPVSAEPLDVAAMTADAVTMLREMLDRRIVLDTTGVEAGLPTVVGDQSELQQVLVNLVLNARDAVLTRADEDGDGYHPVIAIRVGRTVAEGLPAVQVAVQDNGGGIPPEIVERVFDPFFTTKPVGRGTGLGLSMAHSIVHSHGGEITVDSEPGAGTTVRFWLPVDEVPIAAAGQPTPPAHAEEPDLRGRRILVVDDEPNLLDLARFVLEETHADVVTAEGAPQALAEVERAPFDVAIVDVNMPGMNGWQLLERLRVVAPALPVIVVSGFLKAEDVDAHRPTAVIAKPYKADMLIETVHRVATAAAGPER
ncbi:MAG: ATP-binding protein [Dehalococcoidia bacterium]